MRISVTQARGLLTELIRRAEAGDEVVLTRHGKPVVRLVPIIPVAGPEARRALLKSARAAAAARATNAPGAARSQDFLYDDEGLPQ